MGSTYAILADSLIAPNLSRLHCVILLASVPLLAGDRLFLCHGVCMQRNVVKLVLLILVLWKERREVD